MKEVMRSIKDPKDNDKKPFLMKEGERVSLLDDIKLTETPGKHGGEFSYAQAIYAYFDEIEKLKSEGFTLATICKFLEKKEVLPINANPYSLRRAFRRELNRRKQAVSKEESVHDTAKKDMKLKRNAPQREPSRASATEIKQEAENMTISVKPKNSKAGPQVNPDNTFKIAPVDPDDLPDVQ